MLRSRTTALSVAEELLQPDGRRRWRLELQGLSEAEVLDQVRVHLEKEPLADARDRRAFANAVRSMGFVGHWRNGRTRDPRTGVGRKKLRERVRQLDDAVRKIWNQRSFPTSSSPSRPRSRVLTAFAVAIMSSRRWFGAQPAEQAEYRRRCLRLQTRNHPNLAPEGSGGLV